MRLSRAEVMVLVFNVLYLAAALVASIAMGNSEFMLYFVVMCVLLVAVAAVHLKVHFHMGLLWGLSLWGLGHMAGGLLPIPEAWPTAGEGNVLYNLWLVPQRLKYDQLIHAYGFGLVTWACWQGLCHAFVSRGVQTAPTTGLMTLCVAGGMGFGAANEVVEFLATRVLPETNIGGYENTGWDLVANLVGCVLAAGLIYAWPFMKNRSHLRKPRTLAGVLLCAVLSGCGSEPELPESRVSSVVVPPVTPDAVPREPRSDDWFEDKTAHSGVDSVYRNGREGEQYTVLETVGGGVAAFDYDQDGDIDLFFPGGGQITGSPLTIKGLPPKMYRNDGDWQFSDVTEATGLNSASDYSLGCAVGDFDRDGFPDLFVTCYGRSRLFQNHETGFTDVTEAAGLAVDGFSSAAVWADVNRDGWPDLYVVGYLQGLQRDGLFCGDPRREIKDVCGPRLYDGAQDRLFLNRGDDTFEEITQAAGLSNQGKGLGVVAADLDQNGWLDFYVANDTVANELYMGGPEMPFEETALLAGVAVDAYGTPQGSMGIDVGDYDGDGRGDLWVTNFEREPNSLYRSLGGGDFSDTTLAAGLAHICRPQVGFGTGLVDFDSDGWLDLYVLNGHVAYHTGQSPYLQHPALLQNLQGQRFVDRSDRGGPYFSTPHAGRGAAVADLDNDGALDLVCVHHNAPATLLRNRQAPRNWLRVELRGEVSDPAAVGAVASIEYQGRTLVRGIVGGAGYLSHSDRRIVFPVDDDQPRDVTVRWLGGKQEVFRDVPVCQSVHLVEGSGQDER